jgi:hypothetical protein
MNGEHLSPKTRELLDRPMEERIAHIQKDGWIPYSQANRILQQLEDLLHHPKCDRMPNLAISAQTNNGKTRLMKHFLSLHQATEASGGKIEAPVFYVQCPGIPDESRFYSSILRKLRRKFRPPAPASEKLLLVLDALSKIEVRILALDEVNFTEVGTAAKQKRFLNVLRYLANELRISIVCLGTEEMMRVIRSVSSVENRFSPTVLPRWQTGNEFRKLLASFEGSTRTSPAPVFPHRFLICRPSPTQASDSHPSRFPQARRRYPGQQSLARREMVLNTAPVAGSANVAGCPASPLANGQLCLEWSLDLRRETRTGGHDPAPRSNWCS